LAVLGGNIYWVNDVAVGSLASTAAANCTASPPQENTLANAASPRGVAVYGNNVFWATNTNPGSVFQCPLVNCSGNVMTIAANQNLPKRIATDGKNVYWTNEGSNTVMKAPVGGGAAPTVIASGEVSPYNIAVDDTSVYWTSTGTLAKNNDGSVRSATPK
jgi:hypothetical protein